MYSYEIFAERLSKVQHRQFTNNTRMDIKNTDLNQQQIKRNRAINYWQNRVQVHHQPRVDSSKVEEVMSRIESNQPLMVKKEEVMKRAASPSRYSPVMMGTQMSQVSK